MMSTDINKDPYCGVDASGNIHVHTNGRCYTNEELSKELKSLQEINDAAACYLRQDTYSTRCRLGNAVADHEDLTPNDRGVQ